jgi:hypothetical protein
MVGLELLLDIVAVDDGDTAVSSSYQALSSHYCRVQEQAGKQQKLKRDDRWSARNRGA